MKIKEDIWSITSLKNRAADLMDQINETRRPVIITQNGEPRAVIQDPDSYERTKNALALLRILTHSEESLKKGKVIPQEKVFGKLRKKLSGR